MGGVGDQIDPIVGAGSEIGAFGLERYHALVHAAGRYPFVMSLAALRIEYQHVEPVDARLDVIVLGARHTLDARDAEADAVFALYGKRRSLVPRAGRKHAGCEAEER